MHCSFPTLGQLIRFAYAASGVLPRKRGDADGLSERDKKRIQKQLERLADESGNLLEQARGLIDQLAAVLASTITNEKLRMVIVEAAMDLFDVYHVIVRTEGTFLDEREAIRWFCRTHAIGRLALSIEKHPTRFNLASEGLLTPDEADWYLPTFSADGVTWPLSKAMQWTYRVCRTNQTRFHYPDMPDKSSSAENFERARNLANAEDWNKGEWPPSWTTLHWTFSRAFSHLASVEDAEVRRDVPAPLRESIVHVLFLARLSTYVCKALEETYGQAFLEQVVEQLRQHRAWFAPQIAWLRAQTEAFLREQAVPEGALDGVWFDSSEVFWRGYCRRAESFARQFAALREQNNYAPLPEATVSALIRMYGEHLPRTALEALAIGEEVRLPAGFADALLDGFDLKSNPDCADDDIDRYERTLQERQLTDQLGWMVPWLRAAVRYRAEEFQSAFDYIEAAFKRAKYSAGEDQYRLVNLYVELAAKTDRWQSFKKGVAWAQYLDLKIRWLRDDEPTEKNLRGVFQLMKSLRYVDL